MIWLQLIFHSSGSTNFICTSSKLQVSSRRFLRWELLFVLSDVIWVTIIIFKPVKIVLTSTSLSTPSLPIHTYSRWLQCLVMNSRRLWWRTGAGTKAGRFDEISTNCSCDWRMGRYNALKGSWGISLTVQYSLCGWWQKRHPNIQPWSNIQL